MQYITKYATEDQITKNLIYTETVGDKYFDEHGVLQPGHANKFEIHHFALLALFQWGQENARAKEEMYKKHRLRFITQQTRFEYDVKMLVSMMHWDEFNKSFKFIMLNNSLMKKGTSFIKQHEKAMLMLKEQERLVAANFKRGMRYGNDFHAAVRIQEWWLRKKRKFRIYKNIYQLMDEYSVSGGFTGQDSATYFGVGRGKNLLKIQEDMMKQVEMRRTKCRELSKIFVNTTIQKTIECRKRESRQKEKRRVFFAKREWYNISHGLSPTVYGFGSSARWSDHDESYYCERCATTDLSYPGGGRASGNLDHPRWAAQCSRCGQKNPFYHQNNPPSCDEGPTGDEGPSSSFLGSWARRLGITKN